MPIGDISVTAANVARTSGNVNNDYVAGEAFSAGMLVYLKSSNSKWMKAQCDGTAEEAGGGPVLLGIALNTGVLNQPASVQTSGIVNPGGTVTVGTIYCLSAAAGGITPYPDLVTTNKVTPLFIGLTSSLLAFLGVPAGDYGKHASFPVAVP